ncbi:MAG: carbamoyltransferase HypF [Ignavibacteria bacterium]|nr:carbamoyltransferase HypF [Ignavibacteria bacterium]
MKSVRINIHGTVQGVGFRPFVYRLAKELNIKGWIVNSSEGVTIEAEGIEKNVNDFLLKLREEKPVNSSITSFSFIDSSEKNFQLFEIRQSSNSQKKTALILPDIATCKDCEEEIFNPEDRRYLYPFTNCTNCGPRFSIIEAIPYDRANTTMREFEMCDKCKAEYENPLNRRFHAEPIACPDCGPRVTFYDNEKNLISERHDAIVKAAQFIRDGKIVALKGLGGFQLLADASNEKAIKTLRERKHREEKPLAMMFPSLENVKDFCEVNSEEEKLLGSAHAPIVLLRKKENNFIAKSIAPENNYYGVMLPYTPLHKILLEILDTPIAATSGNISDEPICIDNDEAFEKLGGIADYFLVHNRKIVRQVDDSVARIVKGKPFMIRRARGFAPYPVIIDSEVPPAIAAGGHLKNTVAISSGKNIFISQHIGDLDTKEAFGAFKKIIHDFQNLYDVKPETVISDLHPDYVSTKFAEKLDLNHFQVQHHYAHILSCIAENKIEGEVLGICWDGTGFGSDGNIWGGEFLKVNEDKFERFAHLKYFPLPGGEKAIKEIWRTGVSLLSSVQTKEEVKNYYSKYDTNTILNLIEKEINSPLTSSMGRLFDGVSSIINLRQYSSFEGQAAMQLENIVDVNSDERYEFEIIKSQKNNFSIEWKNVIKEVFFDLNNGISKETISSKFHNALVDLILKVCNLSGMQQIALSGGCFQNKFLLEKSVDMLTNNGYKVHWQSEIPTNDGGISLGQMMYYNFLNKNRK